MKGQVPVGKILNFIYLKLNLRGIRTKMLSIRNADSNKLLPSVKYCGSGSALLILESG